DEIVIRKGHRTSEPLVLWGRFARYLEVGEDARALRHVDVFESGPILSYDRSHWVDGFDMLADARIKRLRKQGQWGPSREIPAAEFERIWATARRSPLWRRQKATARMSRAGKVPIWLVTRPRRTT